MKKNAMVPTSNLKRFAMAMNNVLEIKPGIDRMALVYGAPGLGKTGAATWWINLHCPEAAFVRVVKLMSGRWLLSEIVSALGEEPEYRTQRLFEQAVDILAGSDRPVILDEIDYLAGDTKLINSIRDLHDLTGSPFVWIGMEKADRLLKPHRALWRRFSQMVEFKPLGRDDIRTVLEQVCEVPLDASVVDLIQQSHKGGPGVTVAVLYRWAQRAEMAARAKKVKVITAEHLAGAAK